MSGPNRREVILGALGGVALGSFASQASASVDKKAVKFSREIFNNLGNTVIQDSEERNAVPPPPQDEEEPPQIQEFSVQFSYDDAEFKDHPAANVEIDSKPLPESPSHKLFMHGKGGSHPNIVVFSREYLRTSGWTETLTQYFDEQCGREKDMNVALPWMRHAGTGCFLVEHGSNIVLVSSVGPLRASSHDDAPDYFRNLGIVDASILMRSPSDNIPLTKLRLPEPEDDEEYLFGDLLLDIQGGRNSLVHGRPFTMKMLFSSGDFSEEASTAALKVRRKDLGDERILMAGAEGAPALSKLSPNIATGIVSHVMRGTKDKDGEDTDILVIHGATAIRNLIHHHYLSHAPSQPYPSLPESARKEEDSLQS